MKLYRFLQDSTACVTAFSIGISSLALPIVSAQPLPENSPKLSDEPSSPKVWTPPATVRSSESRPPQVPTLVDRPNLEFRSEMAANPTALRHSRVLGVPVIKSAKRGTAKTVNSSETADLGSALATYQKAGGGEILKGRQALEQFVGQHGGGDYGPSVRLELANAYWRTGSWEKALEQWDQAWARASLADVEDVDARRLGDVVLSELLIHNALLGRKERLRAVLKEISGRDSGGDATNAIHRANELLWFLDNRAEQNVFCGFSAANLVCEPLGQKAIYPDVHDEKEKMAFIESGASLWDIAEHSHEGGGNLRCVQKTDPLAAYAVPSVIHWKFGHYSALTARAEDGKLLLADAQLKFSSWVEATVIAQGGTGYALIPSDGALPVGYRQVPEAEARTVFGRHCVHGYDDEGTDCETGCGGVSEHMATYSLNLRRAYHLLTDTPVSYLKPNGSKMYFTLKYSAMPASSNSLAQPYGFGPNWFASFAGGSIEVTGTGAATNTPGSSVSWQNGTGNYNAYVLNVNSGLYGKKQSELPNLTFVYAVAGGPGYRLTFTDGSYHEYLQPVGSPANRFMLTRKVDAQGQTQSYGYDGLGKLTSYTDDWGKVSVISYAPEEGDAIAYTDRIRRITDPHGRFAKFVYHSTGRLKKITDPMGITSEFAYDSYDRITSLTTPYGPTTFDRTSNSIVVTDPRGFKEKLVQTDDEPLQVLTAGGSVQSGTADGFRVRDWNSNSEYGDPVISAPASVAVGTISVPFIPKNNNLHWRNSFHWDKKAMYHSPNDWNAATVYNWKANSSSYIVPVVSSMRVPGQGRVWFNYPGQTSADGAISSYQPSKTVRRMESQGAPVWTMSQQTYNSLGLPLTYTTEGGAQFRINYAANQQDVISVQVLMFIPGGDDTGIWQTLQSYTYPSPSLHLPQTTWSASGLSNTFSYNAKNQITQIETSKDSDVQKERYTYSATGNEVVSTWPGSPGFLRKIERPDSSSATGWVATNFFSYDSVGRIRTHTDAAGYQQTLDYDNFDRVRVITHPDGTTQQLDYDRLDLVAIKDRAGRWSRTIYNSERQPVTQIAADGKTTLLDWCLCGQLQKLTDPLGRETKWTWATGGFLMEKLMPDGVTKTSYTYEPNSGRLSTVTNPNQQGSGNPTVTYLYSVDGRLNKEDYTDPATADVIYGYESDRFLGRLASVTDGIGSYYFKYSGLDPEIKQIDGPITGDVVSYTHGINQQVTSEKLLTEPTSYQSPFLLYDDSNPIRAQAFTQDSLGRTKTITSELGTHTFNYNTLLPRPDSIVGPNGRVSSFAYRPDTAPVGTSRLLANITHTLGAVQQAQHIYDHDRAGRIIGWEQRSIGQPNMKSNFDYNLGDELVRAQDRNLSANTATDQESWGLDDGGNWLSHTRSSGSLMETRKVDAMNRLQGVGGAGSTVIDGHVNEFSQMWVNSQPTPITPDPVSSGYRFKRTVVVTQGSNTVQITAKDQSGQTTQQNWQFSAPAASRTFTYDNNGNTLSDGIRTFTWDAKNRLKTVTKAGVTWKWDYDYRDRRVKEYQNDVLSKYFIWSGNQIIQERNASNVITRTHYEGGFIDGATPATGTNYQTLTVHLGNVREVLTATGAIAARYDYTAYQGAVKIGTSTVDPTFLTIGNYYHHAGSGLDLALYRAYDPELGRWLSVDPLGERGGLNLYGYVQNRPVNAIDPLGLLDLGMIGDAFKVSLGVGLEAGIKQCKLGPVDLRGPSIGAAWKAKGDLAGGMGSSMDFSANLFSASVGGYKAGLGIANESGMYTPNGGEVEVIDQTQKVCGFKKDNTKWSTKSPWTIGLEASAIVNVGVSVDFKKIWDGLWK